MKSVCVYCASSAGEGGEYLGTARRLGRLLSERNIRIINGAGRGGLMAALSESALEAGGKVTGVIPKFMAERGWSHTGLTQIVETGTMHERKSLMAEMGDAAIALPGGCGTLEELMEIITWKQLGIYLKPIIVLNVNGYFNPLFQMLEKAMDEGFMKPSHMMLWETAGTPEEAVGLLCGSPEAERESASWPCGLIRRLY